MQLSENKRFCLKRIADYAFYVAITIELALVILDKSIYIIQYESQWFRLTFALFLIKLVFSELDREELVPVGAFILLGVISYLITGRNDILRLVVMIGACKNVNHDKLFKYVFFFTACGCIVLIILSFCGVGIFSLTRDFGRGEITTRYCLGLGHPNALHCMFWALSLLYLYTYGNRHKWINILVILAANVGLFMLTDSRTGFIATVFTIVLYTVMSLNLPKSVEKLMVYGTYAGIILSFVVSALMMSHKFFWTRLRGLDELLTGRIIGTHMEIMEAKTFFWMPFSMRGRDLQTDLGLVKMFYWYGYVPTIIFIVMCFLLIRTAVKSGDRLALVVVALTIFYSIFEGHDVSVFLLRNYIFLLLGKYWPQIAGVRCIKDSEADG